MPVFCAEILWKEGKTSDWASAGFWETIMRPKAHIISGALMGTAVLALTGKMEAAVLCGAGNVLSDTDHLLEYAAYCVKYRSKPSVGEFMSGRYFAEKGTLGVVFHAHEYAAAMAVFSALLWRKKRRTARNLAAFASGYGMHMLLDLIGNDCTWKGYSILYRASVRFDEKTICCKSYRKSA